MNNVFCTGRARALKRAGSALACTVLLLAVVCCAGNPAVPMSSARMEAIRHNQRGIKAEAEGRSPQALLEFTESLRINRAIENSEGIVVALVNSSRVHRHNGDAVAALAAINGAIPLALPQSPLYFEVTFEMAQVKLALGEVAVAYEWALKATGAEDTLQRGMKKNLVARILYLKGNLTEAEAAVRDALSINREAGMRDEEANSLRLLGDILIGSKRSAEAGQFCDQALAIDKAAGKSRKIAADLRCLAAMSVSLNDPDQALAFYQRAFAVSSADNDRAGAAGDLLVMSRIHAGKGEKEHSERLLAERDLLLKGNK